MKITRVEAVWLQVPIAEERQHVSDFGRATTFDMALVRIETDAGITGVGEAKVSAGGTGDYHGVVAVINSEFAPGLIGQDPRNITQIWEGLYNGTRGHYALARGHVFPAMSRRGVSISAISGIDIALWDILGKVRGEPVAKLLGGMFRDRVQAYATGFYRTTGRGEAPRLAQEAVMQHEAGFRALKVKLGFGIEDDLEVMRAIRDATAGRAYEAMIDTNHAYGVAEAIALGRGLEDMGWKLRWYEEPVTQEDLDGCVEVRRALATPIAGGENEYTLFGFRELFARRAVDVAQPDLCAAGGFTGCRHIVALAHAHGVQVNPHVWASAVGQAASLQLIAALPVAHHALFAREPLLEFDTSSHPFREHLTDSPLRQRDGWVEIPQHPGLGIEVSRRTLQQYAA
jgi:D-galactarolactone cycloisomerase